MRNKRVGDGSRSRYAGMILVTKFIFMDEEVFTKWVRARQYEESRVKGRVVVNRLASNSIS